MILLGCLNVHCAAQYAKVSGDSTASANNPTPAYQIRGSFTVPHQERGEVELIVDAQGRLLAQISKSGIQLAQLAYNGALLTERRQDDGKVRCYSKERQTDFYRYWNLPLNLSFADLTKSLMQAEDVQTADHEIRFLHPRHFESGRYPAEMRVYAKDQLHLVLRFSSVQQRESLQENDFLLGKCNQ